MMLTLFGLIVRLGAALWATRVMNTILFEVNANDPMRLMIVSTMIVIVALMACYAPVRRATRIDPLAALRHE